MLQFYLFAFFNILAVKISSYYEILCRLLYYEILLFFIFLTKPKVLLFDPFFILKLFKHTSVTILSFFDQSTNKLKILFLLKNNIYDWCIIYLHFVSSKKTIDQNVTIIQISRKYSKISSYMNKSMGKSLEIRTLGENILKLLECLEYHKPGIT